MHFKQTTMATAMRISANKRFNEQNNSSKMLVHFQAFLCETTMQKDLILHILNMNNDG